MLSTRSPGKNEWREEVDGSGTPQTFPSPDSREVGPSELVEVCGEFEETMPPVVAELVASFQIESLDFPAMEDVDVTWTGEAADKVFLLEFEFGWLAPPNWWRMEDTSFSVVIAAWIVVFPSKQLFSAFWACKKAETVKLEKPTR